MGQEKAIRSHPKNWIRTGVRARHRQTGMLLRVMVLVSGVYDRGEGKRFRYVYGADCSVHGKVCRFRTDELEPVE